MVKSSQYVELANDLEINKAITYLRQKDFNQVNVFAETAVKAITLDSYVSLLSLLAVRGHISGERWTLNLTYQSYGLNVLPPNWDVELNRTSIFWFLTLLNVISG